MHAIRTAKESNSAQRDAGRLLTILEEFNTIRDPQSLTSSYAGIGVDCIRRAVHYLSTGKLQGGLTVESWGKTPEATRHEGIKYLAARGVRRPSCPTNGAPWAKKGSQVFLPPSSFLSLALYPLLIL